MKKLFFVLSLFAFLNKAHAKPLDITFEQHITNLKSELTAKGYDATILDKVFEGNFVVDKKVKRALKNQPEVKFSFDRYYNGKLTEWRITNGKKFYQQYRPFLKQLEQQYNVDGAVVIALWGLETNYGTYPLKHNAIRALTNMTYTHSRESRRAFFKRELFDAFEVTKRFDIDPMELKGSWAGALGQCQFMPSNVLKYTADGNKDGRIDIWNTREDVFASAANFVKILGWKPNEVSFTEVTVPAKYNILAKRVYKPVNQWQAEGLKLDKQISSTQKLKMFAPENEKNKVFLVSKNFDVIKRWNNSDYFAFSVLSLAEEIKK